MNFEVFPLNLMVDPDQVKECLCCLLHTIIFNRAFGQTVPVEVDCDFVDFTYVRIDNDEIVKLVDANVGALASTVVPNQSARTAMTLSWLEKKSKKVWGFSKEENSCWEQWTVALAVEPVKSENERADRKRRLARELAQNTATIVQIVNTKQSHIPPVHNNRMVPFPFEISTPSSPTGWGLDFFKGMIADATPTFV